MNSLAALVTSLEVAAELLRLDALRHHLGQHCLMALLALGLMDCSLKAGEHRLFAGQQNGKLALRLVRATCGTMRLLWRSA